VEEGMKMLVVVGSSLSAIVLVSFVVLGFMSKSGSVPGLLNDTLTECPAKPNCICSEYESDLEHYLQPIHFSSQQLQLTHEFVKQIVGEMGGSVQFETEHYIASTFSSSVFGFVDDFEIRLDVQQGLIHFRSASRVGHSDAGVNLNRAETFKTLYQQRMSEAGN
jgi:uncharacterized protein (DUF1499 family)